jgi:hypothetical protein
MFSIGIFINPLTWGRSGADSADLAAISSNMWANNKTPLINSAIANLPGLVQGSRHGRMSLFGDVQSGRFEELVNRTTR